MTGDLPRFYLNVVEKIHGDGSRNAFGRFLPRRLETWPELNAVVEGDAGVCVSTCNETDVGNACRERKVDGRSVGAGDLAGIVLPPHEKRAGFGDSGEMRIACCDLGDGKRASKREFSVIKVETWKNEKGEEVWNREKEEEEEEEAR